MRPSRLPRLAPSVLVGLVLAAVLASAARAAEPLRTPLTAELMWKLHRLAAPAISPDGRWAVVQVTTFDVAEDKKLADLWLVRTDGGESRPLTSHEGPETSPAWSPDGTWIAFVGKRGEDEAGQLYVIPFAGGRRGEWRASPRARSRRSGSPTRGGSSSPPRSGPRRPPGRRRRRRSRSRRSPR